jgi:predicted dehydrogenase
MNKPAGHNILNGSMSRLARRIGVYPAAKTYPKQKQNQSMKKYKVLIIGAGDAGTNLHYPAYAALDNVEVAAFCDVNEQSARAACNRFGVKGAYTDMHLAIKEIRPDIISVTTPPKTHYQVAKDALDSKAVVIVEKPIFTNLEEAIEIREYEKKSGGRFVPVHNKLGLASTRQAVDMYRNGELGKVVHVNAYWMNEGTKNAMTSNPEHWSHKLTGGRWEELVSHPIYQAYQFVGKMKLAYVDLIKTESSLPWLPGDEVVIVLKAELGYVTIRLSSNTTRYNYYEVFGTKNSVLVENENATLKKPVKLEMESTVLKAALSRGILSRGVRAIYRRIPKPGSRNTVQATPTVAPKYGGKHYEYLKEIISCIDSGSEFPVSWDEALNTLELATEIGKEIGRQWK